MPGMMWLPTQFIMFDSIQGAHILLDSHQIIDGILEVGLKKGGGNLHDNMTLGCSLL